MNAVEKQKQRGFTLIELVVVIALLAILAAFAIPRYAGLEREARSATILSVSGSIAQEAQEGADEAAKILDRAQGKIYDITIRDGTFMCF